MKSNHEKITGVHHHKQHSDKYHLRRYIPADPFCDIIEQFWFVNWHFTEGDSHTQQNLPDPNFHLIIRHNELKILGPITKSYHYKMTGDDYIIGIKFHVGALYSWLRAPLNYYVDREVNLREVIQLNEKKLLAQLALLTTDEQKVKLIQKYLKPFVSKPSQEIVKVRAMLKEVKLNSHLTKVDMLADISTLSARTIQRYFKRYVGLSPKWLIRKYRLHQALAMLEQDDVNFLDIVDWLGYSDQSHLIRDFKEIIGETPLHYLNENK